MAVTLVILVVLPSRFLERALPSAWRRGAGLGPRDLATLPPGESPRPTKARALRARRAGRYRDGFSLMELLAVIFIMSVLASVAAPKFVAAIRDRRVAEAALRIANFYRTAHMLAVGRGLPIIVNWSTGSAPAGILQIVEPALAASGGAIVPPSSCSQVNWTFYPNPLTVSAALNGVQLVDALDLSTSTYAGYAGVSLAATIGPTSAPITYSPASYLDVCFSPSGLSYARASSTGAFTQLTTVPIFTVTNLSTGLPRQVFVPPNGVARIAL